MSTPYNPTADDSLDDRGNEETATAAPEAPNIEAGATLAQHSITVAKIPSAPGYLATSNGEVVSADQNWRGNGQRVLKKDINRHGYFIVRVQVDGKRIVLPVHRAVLLAFRGYPDTGEWREARHLNGNRQDNRIENLDWGTRKENAADRLAHGNAPKGETHSEAIKAGIAKARQNEKHTDDYIVASVNHAGKLAEACKAGLKFLACAMENRENQAAFRRQLQAALAAWEGAKQ